MVDNRFYVYMWLRKEERTPYYIGKGCGKRAIRKGSPREMGDIVIRWCESEDDAYNLEKKLILFYGRKDLGTGILINRSEGGYGIRGVIWTDEHRQKLSEALKGRKFSKSHRENIRKSRMGLKPSKEARKNMSLAQTGRKHTEESKEKMSKIKKANPSPHFGPENGMFGKKRPELSAFNTRTKKGKKLSAETRERMSKAHLGKPLSEEHKLNMRHPHKSYTKVNRA